MFQVIRVHTRWLQAAVLAGVFSLALGAHAQEAQSSPPGSIVGKVTLEGTNEALHGARVLLVQLGRSVLTDLEGAYVFEGVPAGEYELFAVREHLRAARATVEVIADTAVRLDFQLALEPVHEQVTVTASGRETSVLDTFSSVQVLDSIEVARNMAGNLGELLEGQPGVARRSFGPGSSRPIIRGFDNDRVLIMQDGVRTGDLSSQSGDHGTSIDPGSVQRVEIIKGPATLLYGSNAIGGVVNTMSPQEQYYSDPVDEIRGQVNADLGSTNAQAGGNANFQIGNGAWMGWFGGGARRSGDYSTPDGTVNDSDTRLVNARGGGGYFGAGSYASVGYQYEDSLYGVPYAGAIESGDPDTRIALSGRRDAVRLDLGLRDMQGSFFENVRGSFNYSSWHHEEIETLPDGESEVGSQFDNEILIGRLEAQHRRLGRFQGQFGAWGQHRDYVATGEEALSPPTTQDALAGFLYEEATFDAFALQAGARVESNSYDPDVPPDTEDPAGRDIRPRDFTGVSASAGIRVPFADRRGTFVANVSSSYRAPALEELYNYGPHVGNLSFEIGNPDLQRERSNGGELIFRWNSPSMHGEASGFYYAISDFIFGAQTGEIVDGLIEVVYDQDDARFVGGELQFSFHVTQQVHVNVEGSLVSARLTATDEPLPRIPPAVGRLGLDWSPTNQIEVEPEVVFAAAQNEVYGAELPTDGYTLLNVLASYTIAGAKTMHVISLKATNLTNALYRNHTSLIKELAPEMGRRILLTYALRLF